MFEEYPEHEKLKAIPEEVRQQLGDWLSEQIIAEWGCVHGCTKRVGDGWDCLESNFCRLGDTAERLWPRRISVQQLIAEIFEIDYEKLMEEKERIYNQMGELHQLRTASEK